jgi:hypothetical protein
MYLFFRQIALFAALLAFVSSSEADEYSRDFSGYRFPHPGVSKPGSTDSIPPMCRPPHRPVPEIQTPERYSTVSDTTPPTPPQNVSIVRESIHSLFGHWEEASDPESGIDYYAFAIGTQPGEADLRWWQSTGLSLSSYGLSMSALDLAEGDTVYLSVEAVNGAGLGSEIVSVGPEVFSYDLLGEAHNEITIDLAGPWSENERTDIMWFMDRMLPLIKEIYGPPSHSYTVTLVKDSLYSSSAVFFPGSNEIHMDQLHPQLLTHEIIHAFRDNVILSSDVYWSYESTLSGFEESFAQGISYVCMNRYVQLYPADPVVPGNTLYDSFYGWDYDYQNTDILTTTDYWSDGGGTGIFWLRYEIGAAALLKILKDHPDFVRDFNREYYNRLNGDHDLTTSRGLMLDLVSLTAPMIEGTESTAWVNRQHIFDCFVRSGRKIFVKIQHYPGWEEYLIFQSIFYYETFFNGSEWAYWDSNSEEWVYHNLNGSTGTSLLYDYNDELIWQKGLLIEPTQNPPDYYGFGCEIVHLSTDDDTSPWPGGDANDFILDLTDLGLYRLEFSFGAENTEVFRVMGDPLRNTAGVFGAVLNGAGGWIYLNHEDYPEEPPIPVENGVFHGERVWASIDNPNTGYKDSAPGRIFIVYRDENGDAFRDQRNIDLGSWSGNQLFLFDTQDMTRIQRPGQVVLVSPADGEVIGADSLEFLWFRSGPEVSRYWFELATDSLMVNVSIDSTLLASDTTKVHGTFVDDQTYWWRVRAGNQAGWGEFSELRKFSVAATGIDNEQKDLPKAFSLAQNYPNPFNPSTSIRFDIPTADPPGQAVTVTLRIYNTRGRQVRTLYHGVRPPGRFFARWDGTDDSGETLPSGIYIYRIQAGSFTSTRKMVLLK